MFRGCEKLDIINFLKHIFMLKIKYMLLRNIFLKIWISNGKATFIKGTLDSLINAPGTFINFWKFFQGVCSYLRGYVYWIWRFLDTKLEFSPKNPLYYNILLILSMGIRLYQGVRLLILKKTPGGTIIPGGTFIRESRVQTPETLC